MKYHLINAVGEDVTGQTCYDCGGQFIPQNLPPQGFVGNFSTFFYCENGHNRAYSGEIECSPENPTDRKSLRRRIEDALRKTASDAELLRIASILNVHV